MSFNACSHRISGLCSPAFASSMILLAMACLTPSSVTSEIPNEAGQLRRQAGRALRLARGISDDHAARALKVLAATLSERAASLEQYQPPQQQQKIQSEDKDKDEET